MLARQDMTGEYLTLNMKIKGKPHVKQNIHAKLRLQPKSKVAQLWNTLLRTAHKLNLIDRGQMKDMYAFGETIREVRKENVICNAGFNAICKRLDGDNTYTGEVTHMLFGTGTGTPDASDTTLFNETYRNTTASGTDSSNVVYLTAFLTETEYPSSGSVTITEFGNAIDGSSSADTGQLWSHIAGLSWEKDTSTSLTVDCEYTFTS